MNDLVALIVGIERYDQPGWNVPGPCANAIAIARWLLDIEALPANIHLFLAPGPDLEDAIAGLEVAGVRVCRQADFNTIDNFLRGALSKDRAAGSRLLVYWSGHGFTRNDGTRVFICSDYTAEEFRNRVFDGLGLRRALHRSPDYQCFCEQVFLADVCANYYNYAHLDFQVLKWEAAAPVISARQVAFFATREGEYARRDNGLGAFTRIALAVLGQYSDWPILDGFSSAMHEACAQAGHAPFRYDSYGDGAEVRNRLVGAIEDTAGNAIGASVRRLLSGVSLQVSVYQTHYRNTAISLGNPGLLAKQEPTRGDMITELTSLHAEPGEIPAGLIEFLVRLSAEPALTKRIAAWLKKHAAEQKHDQANAREKIEDEGRNKILIVELQNNDQEDIKHCKWSLWTMRLQPVHEIPAGVALHDEAVGGWNDFVQRFPSVVTALHAAHPISEIHFAINSPLFDRPFHRIAIDGGRLLGEAFVVLVRFLDRLRDRSPWSRTRHCWCAHAAALRGARPDTIEVLPIPGPGSAPPEAQGFCYTRFTVPRAPGGAQKLTLQKWLFAGYPYLVWFHEPPPGEDWDALAQRYANWLQKIDTLDKFPGAFTDRRLHDQPAAQQATLLWDDPACNPFDIQGH